MPKGKKGGGGRGTVVKNLWDLSTSPAAAGGAGNGSRRSDDVYSGVSTTLTTYRRPRPARYVDPAALKRSFMLQHFQFILRADLPMATTAVQGLPQGQRRLLECLQCSDDLVPWETVHSVVMRTAIEEFTCPICMDVPTAPRITECGHVYCLPCILQYMHRQKAAAAPRTCPMCHELLALYALRPCVLQLVRPLEVGVQARFDLFKRPRNCCVLRRFDDAFFLSTPPSRSPSSIADLQLPTYMDPSSYQSRYVVASAQYEAGQRCADGAGISERMRELDSLPRPLTESEAEMGHFLLEALNEVSKEPKGLASSLSRHSPPMAPRPVLTPATENDGGYVELYAEGEGQPFYLHMLTVKMLRHDAALRGMPPLETVTGPVEEVITMEQTEATRRIYKVFSHVPLHSTIKLCVVNIDDILLPETRAAFAETLRKMANDRSLRQRHDASAASEDDSWKQYLLKYSGHRSGSDVGYSSHAVPSDFSIDTDSLPYLKLPSTASSGSDHGLPPNALDTRQRATKRQDVYGGLVDSAEAPPSPSISASTATAAVASARPPTNATSSATAGCWARGGAAKLFTKTDEHVTASTSTWGGHAFHLKR